MVLDGKVAVVTAGANGIGEGAALALAGMGADVVIGDIDTANGKRVASAIRALGRRAHFHPTDMMQTADARALVRFAVERMGRIDVLVNNAGACARAPSSTRTMATGSA